LTESIREVCPVGTPVPVDTLNIHRAAHLDELATAVIVADFGEPYFPGASQALRDLKVSFDEHSGWTRADYINNRTLPIGTGYGTWFNEHIRTGDRMEGFCAFTLATRYIRVDELPALKRLQSEVYLCDTRAECKPTMLAELVKVDVRRQTEYTSLSGKRISIGERTQIIQWLAPAIRAIIRRENQILRGQLNPVPNGKDLRDRFKAWLKDYEDANGPLEERVKNSLFMFINASMASKDATVTEFAFVVEAMTQIGIPDETIQDWAEFGFVAMHMNQLAFFEEYDRQCKLPEPEEILALVQGRNRTILLSIVEQSKMNSQKVARYRRNQLQKDRPESERLYGITLQRTPSGNYQIFADDELKDSWTVIDEQRYVGLQEAAIRMIRTLELIKMGAPVPEFKELGGEGEGPDRVWYYFKRGAILLNGSLTSTRPASNIGLGDLIDVLRHAYHPGTVEEWRKRVLSGQRLRKCA
jgi:hypothetical protein